MIEIVVALVTGVLLGWGLAWHAGRTFRFEVTITKEEEVREAEKSDENDADWWKEHGKGEPD